MVSSCQGIGDEWVVVIVAKSRSGSMQTIRQHIIQVLIQFSFLRNIQDTVNVAINKFGTIIDQEITLQKTRKD